MTTDLDGAMVLVGKLTIRCEEQRATIDRQKESLYARHDANVLLAEKLVDAETRCEEQRLQLDGQRAANVALAKELAAALEQAEAYRQALLEVTSARDELVRERQRGDES